MGNCCSERSVTLGAQGGLTEPLRESFAAKNPDVKILKVWLKQMENIPMQGIVCNPFCEFRLKGKDGGWGEQVQTSTMKTETDNPAWTHNEQFIFKVANTKSAKIVCTVYSTDPAAFDRKDPPIILGELVIKCKDLTLGKKELHKKYGLVDRNGAKHGNGFFNVHLSSPIEAMFEQEQAVYEFQRWVGPLIAGGQGTDLNPHWGGKEVFFKDDPGRWGSLDGRVYKDELVDISPPLTDDYEVYKDWAVTPTFQDPDGWEYSTNFKDNFWYSSADRTVRNVRRRIHQRVVHMKPRSQQLRLEASAGEGDNFENVREFDALMSVANQGKKSFSDHPVPGHSHENHHTTRPESPVPTKPNQPNSVSPVRSNSSQTGLERRVSDVPNLSDY